MRHVVNFSGGLCSFWAAHRVIQKHGPEKVVLLFADVLIEDPELYEFNERASALLGVAITRICQGETPWQLFRRKGIIGNSFRPVCSFELKREPLDAWHEKYCLNIAEEGQVQLPFLNDGREPATIYLGFDWTEPHRVADIRREKPLWRIEAPMTEEPIWDKCKMTREAEKLGLKIPRLYELGFPHNNCGGRCVRAGISHWVHLLRVLPERFTEWMNEEQDTIREIVGRGGDATWCSILKDRRGGKTKAMTLVELKSRVDAGEQFPRDDWGGCGCGGATGAIVVSK